MRPDRKTEKTTDGKNVRQDIAEKSREFGDDLKDAGHDMMAAAGEARREVAEKRGVAGGRTKRFSRKEQSEK